MSKPFGSSGGSTPTGFRAAGAGALPAGPGLGGGGDRYDTPSPPSDPGMGKIDVDITDVLGSIAGGVGSIQSFLGGENSVIGRVPIVGNILGGVGALGEGIGGVELPRLEIPRRIGPVDFHYAGNDPEKNQPAAHIGDIPGMMMNVLMAPFNLGAAKIAEGRLIAEEAAPASWGKVLGEPGRAIETLFATNPITALPHWIASGGGNPIDSIEAGQQLPPDIALRLANGEPVGALAEEMVARGAGLSSNPVTEIGASVVFDPMNLIGAGVGRVQTVARTLDAGQDYNRVERALGTAFRAGTRGMSELGVQSMRGVFGPVTAGVVQGLGPAEYVGLKRTVTGLNPEYGNRLADDLGRGIAQMDRAVLANEMGVDATAQLAAKGENIGVGLEARLTARRAADPGVLSRDAEALISRKTPSFLGYTTEQLVAESAPKLAAITGMSLPDAERVLAGMATKTARVIHLAFYGHVGHELEEIKTALDGVPDLNIDVRRLTSLAPDTLHDQRAKALIKELAPGAGAEEAADAAVHQYSVLTEAYLGRKYTAADVRKLVQQLLKEDALPTVVREPKSRKNPLPSELTGWRGRWRESGYDLGFSPEDGWKVIIDKDGVVVASDPFVHFSSEIAPATVRNPLGRFTDSLFRGINQTMILYDSRDRFITAAFDKGTGISPNQARSIYRALLDKAAERATSTRGLAWHPKDIEDAFRSILNDAEYATLRETVDPTWMLMHAFEGSLGKVGLTQKITGRVKTITTIGGQNPIAALTDAVYPGVKFKWNPMFQGQELVESPFFNIMRGVIGETVTPEIQVILDEMMNLPEYKFLQEAGPALNLAGTLGVQKTMGNSTRLGQALSRVPNVKAFKRQKQAQQLMYEHGEHFQDAVLRINPALWRAMTDAYGTTDPRRIAAAYFAERLTSVREAKPVSWRVDDVARQMEDSRPAGFGNQTVTRGDPVWDQETVSAAFQTWGISGAEADALAALTEARARTWAVKYNLPASDWYASHLADITTGGTPGELAQVSAKVVEKITRIVGDDAGMALRLIAPNDEAQQLTRLNRLRRVAASGKQYAPQGGKQTRLTWVNYAGRQVVHYVGGVVNGRKWVEMADSTMDHAQILEAGRWYDDFAEAIATMFPADAQRVLMGFAATQNALGVDEGMALVVETYRAMKAGTVSEKTATEIINRAVMAGLEGTPPSYKDAPKLSDFFDSFTAKATRTYVGDDVRGLRPAAIDRHTIRDVGFVDPAIQNRLAKLSGQRIPIDLKDNGSFNRSQYDFGLTRINKITDEINKLPGGWHGRSDWTPREIQAIGWYRVRLATNDIPSGITEALDPLTRRVSFDLGISPERQLGRLFPDVSTIAPEARAAISRGMADWARTELAPAVGVGVRQVVDGPGFWQDDPASLALHMDIVSSDRGIAEFTDALGDALQQYGMVAAKPVNHIGEANHLGVTFLDGDPAATYQALRAADPEVFIGGQVIDGKLMVLVDLDHADDVPRFVDQALGPETRVEYSPMRADFRENDWSTTGNAYRQRLHEAGRTDLTEGGGLDRLSASAVRRIDELFEAHAPAELAAHRAAGLAEADQAALAAARRAGQGPVEYARFGRDARGNAVVPTAFRSEPGYVYRTVNRRRAGSDWRVGEYVAKHPATIYAESDNSVVLRTRRRRHRLRRGHRRRRRQPEPAGQDCDRGGRRRDPRRRRQLVSGRRHGPHAARRTDRRAGDDDLPRGRSGGAPGVHQPRRLLGRPRALPRLPPRPARQGSRRRREGAGRRRWDVDGRGRGAVGALGRALPARGQDRGAGVAPGVHAVP